MKIRHSLDSRLVEKARRACSAKRLYGRRCGVGQSVWLRDCGGYICGRVYHPNIACPSHYDITWTMELVYPQMVR